MAIGIVVLSSFLALVGVSSTAVGPAAVESESAPARAVRFTTALEANPLGEDAPDQRAWLIEWLVETPDFTVTVCDILGPIPAEDLAYGPELLMQQMFGNVTYQIMHPGKADEATLQIAGIESVLKVYAAIVAKDPKAQIPYFDDLLAKRESGLLKESMLPVIAKSCGPLEPALADDMRDIYAPSEYADFIREIAILTALAETAASDVVKFLMIAKGEDGQIVVRTIGLLSIGEHAPSADSESVGMAAIAHIHHERMVQAPSKEDALTVRQHGIPNFVISSDGRLIWEVGVIAGKDVYREIGATSIGPWLDLK